MSNNTKNPSSVVSAFKTVAGSTGGDLTEKLGEAIVAKAEEVMSGGITKVLDNLTISVHAKGSQIPGTSVSSAGFVRDVVSVSADVDLGEGKTTKVCTGCIISTPDTGGAIIRSENIHMAGVPHTINRYSSETYDAVFVELIKKELQAEEVEVGDYIIIRNADTNIDNITKVLLGYLISFGLRIFNQLSTLKDDEEFKNFDYTGIEGLVNSEGNLVYDKDKLINGSLPVNATFTRPPSSDVTNEYGIPLAPTLMLDVTTSAPNAQQGYSRTLNVLSDSSGSITSTPLSVGLVYVGPEQNNNYAIGQNDPRYKSFMMQIISEDVKHDPVPSIGKSLLTLASSTYLNDMREGLLSPEVITVMEEMVNTKGAVKPKPLTINEAEANYSSFFNAYLRNSVAYAVRVTPGTRASLADKMWLSSDDVIGTSITKFFERPGYTPNPALMTVPKVTAATLSFLGTYLDNNSDTCSLSSIDQLTIIHAFGVSSSQSADWYQATTMDYRTDEARVLMEGVIKDLSGGNYEIEDVSVLVTPSPELLTLVIAEFSNVFSVSSNANEFVNTQGLNWSAYNNPLSSYNTTYHMQNASSGGRSDYQWYSSTYGNQGSGYNGPSY